MSKIKKSRSYPERLNDAYIRQSTDEKKDLEQSSRLHIETIRTLKEKDYERTQRLAELGSPSSRDVIVLIDWKAKCCDAMARTINYFLEREEETKTKDEIIRKKSYAGFYYFIKWFTRAMFFLIFTTLGTILGKEIGCLVKDHDTCKSGVVELADSSPHVISSILGFVFGLILGQWIGRLIWDNMTYTIRRCLRKIEKWSDRTKIYLLLLSMTIYIIVTIIFAIIFWIFIDFGQDSDNLIGAVTGGCIGLILAILAYRKSSSCQTGQDETPMINGTNSSRDPPDLIVI